MRVLGMETNPPGKGNAPNVSGNFQLYSNLKQLTHGPRPLNPCNAPSDGSRFTPRFVVGHFERNPHIFQNVVFGLVARAVAINDKRGGALLKWAAKRVHSRYCERNGLHDPAAAPLLCFRIRMQI